MYWKVSLFSVTIIVHSLTSILQSTLAIRTLNTSSGVYVGRTIVYGDTIVQQYLGIQYGRVVKRFDRAVANVKANDELLHATDFGSVCKPAAGSCVANVGMFSLPTSRDTRSITADGIGIVVDPIECQRLIVQAEIAFQACVARREEAK